jgi:hypothetical protein
MRTIDFLFILSWEWLERERQTSVDSVPGSPRACALQALDPRGPQGHSPKNKPRQFFNGRGRVQHEGLIRAQRP